MKFAERFTMTHSGLNDDEVESFKKRLHEAAHGRDRERTAPQIHLSNLGVNGEAFVEIDYECSISSLTSVYEADSLTIYRTPKTSFDLDEVMAKRGACIANVLISTLYDSSIQEFDQVDELRQLLPHHV